MQAFQSRGSATKRNLYPYNEVCRNGDWSSYGGKGKGDGKGDGKGGGNRTDGDGHADGGQLESVGGPWFARTAGQLLRQTVEAARLLF